METLKFLNPEQVRGLKAQFGSPLFVYDERMLRANAAAATAFPNAFGVTARYAMKANPNASILRIFHACGMHIDASSVYEVERALRAGIPADHISLSSQQLAEDLADLDALGVKFNATSINQLRSFGQQVPGGRVGLRFNPGLGSGGTTKTNVGGPASSFGIWHAYKDETKAIAAEYNLTIERIHSHIGSGSDPAVWQKVSVMNLDLVREFPDVTTLNLGGGYKVGRMSSEVSTDLQTVGQPVKDAFAAFAVETGRELKLEIEPGTFMVANAGAILCRIQDVVDTGPEGYQFLKIDSGMTDLLRTCLYGAQHPMVVVHAEENRSGTNAYIISGHCCESGDMLTPSPDDPEQLLPRELAEARIGDVLVIDGAGAYCSAMCAKNYNSFPETAEVLVEANDGFRLIRKPQTLDQILANEV
ncbi:MAG: diaminopimelate decarboxylase [Kiritimatiellia bacterium]|jgi:diaminopimelate decarboxylase